MGSLRNPVGPLPSTIYWRRRAVALCLVAVLALLAVWALTSGDGGGKKAGEAAGGPAPTPPSITPGPAGTGPAISQQPGGRDESGGSGDSSGDSGDGDGDGSGSGTDAGSGADAGAGGVGKNGDTDGAGGDGGAGTGAGQRVPANSPLPNCPPGSLQLTLRSVKLSYEAGEKPTFHLVAKNTSDTACKADFGPRSAVLTISDKQDDAVWASDHCPASGAAVLLSLPAGATITHTVEWDRGRSAPGCATAPAGAAGPGTYLVEATMPGAKVSPASFTLAKD